MTPAARIAAAIEVLDRILAGHRAENALTAWGRANRYAGSGDRNAVADLVYDALRCRRSFAWAGGAEDGRGLMLGRLRLAGTDPGDLFTGERHAPPPVRPDEAGRPLAEAPEAVRLDIPDWLLPRFKAALDDRAEAALETLRHRAPVWLRVNPLKTTAKAAAAALAAAGIETRPHPEVVGALEATGNARRVVQSDAYLDGLVEIQDAASQAAVRFLGDVAGLRVLDYCAGAGGKALQLAALGAEVTAHDANPARMSDLAPRARRAGARIALARTPDLPALAPWPLVVVDAPCSGSGTWRREPEAKWALTPQRLDELVRIQDSILDAAAALTAPGGRIGYLTCSVLRDENADRVSAFLARNPRWAAQTARAWMPGPLGDGFGAALLVRDA